MKVKPQHEDRIYAVKTFISELSKVQDLYFQNLVKEMDITPTGEEYLFDYIFNSTEEEDFEHYLDGFTENRKDKFELYNA